MTINTILENNSYPGRGIMIGRSACGKFAVTAYFIMGRSVNSRNRIFTATADGIRTEAFDPSMMSDPSLIIYHPVRHIDGRMIVTNGDQTDTVRDFIADGKTFEEALRTRKFEPDEPNFTPRISGIIEKDGSYKLSILKSQNGNAASVQRYFFEYAEPVAGTGHFIHTYKCDGNPIPSFEGEPEFVELPPASPEEFAEAVWNSLNADNKVSLYVNYTFIEDGKEYVIIKNKNV
ncbi:MAG: IMP cyclohydrolase [Clostridiales bacterium]|nr:IMP cyclohydrolase [Clostridiales bacterium]